LQGELRKINPPTFNGEHQKGEEVETWILEMKKYFQLHDYPSRVEARIATYHLQERNPCGGINLRNPRTLMRKESHGGSSRDISR
jgi:hypothetical protein